MLARLTPIIAALALLAVPATASAARTLPRLPRADAERYASQAVVPPLSTWAPQKWAFSTIRCTRRINGHHMRCSASLSAGEAQVTGTIRVWYAFDRKGRVAWRYAYRLTVLLVRCRFVDHRPADLCRRVEVAR